VVLIRLDLVYLISIFSDISWVCTSFLGGLTHRNTIHWEPQPSEVGSLSYWWRQFTGPVVGRCNGKHHIDMGYYVDPLDWNIKLPSMPM
jgi:hypothetical protein